MKSQAQTAISNTELNEIQKWKSKKTDGSVPAEVNRPVIVAFGVCCEKSPRRWSIHTVEFIQRNANDL